MVKTHHIVFLLLMVSIASAISGCTGPGVEETETFTGDYEASQDTVLKVTNVNGQIEINAWDGETVTLEAVKRTRYGKEELDKVEIVVTESDNEIKIEAKPSLNARVSVDMDIRVPDNTIVEFAETSNGNIEISDTRGNTTASTSNGQIRMENIDGYVKAITSNGRIDIMGTTGIDDLETSNGDIHAEIFDLKGDVEIRSSNGNIIVYINPSLNADIDAETSNGRISVNDITVNLTEMRDTHMEGKLGDGGYSISMRTSNGNVELNQLVV